MKLVSPYLTYNKKFLGNKERKNANSQLLWEHGNKISILFNLQEKKQALKKNREEEPGEGNSESQLNWLSFHNLQQEVQKESRVRLAQGLLRTTEEIRSFANL